MWFQYLILHCQNRSSEVQWIQAPDTGRYTIINSIFETLIMISKKMQKAINEQINAELWSAYLYLSMAMDAEAKALKGIANWFFVQWLEEQDYLIFQIILLS